jgi:antitoxin (DNA-binding transcriptional repressor) of toxin-antitoxin stability system
MEHVVSKSKFKASALRYFREVERTGEPLIITDCGRPALKIVRCGDDPDRLLDDLRGSVLAYQDPTESVGEDDWEALG